MQVDLRGGDCMFKMLFMIMMLIVFVKLFIFGMKACWGLTKIIFTVILLPLFLLVLVFRGFMYLAVPILIVAGIAAILYKD